MTASRLAKNSLLISGVLIFLVGVTTGLAAPTPSNFYGNLYINEVAWTAGDQDHHIQMDVYRDAGGQKVLILEKAAEFDMSNAEQDFYTLKLSFDDQEPDSIHSEYH